MSVVSTAPASVSLGAAILGVGEGTSRTSPLASLFSYLVSLVGIPRVTAVRSRVGQAQGHETTTCHCPRETRESEKNQRRAINSSLLGPVRPNVCCRRA